MASYKGENMARRSSISKDNMTATREFTVISTSQTEYGPSIVAVVPVSYKSGHPAYAGLFAMFFDPKQDRKCWWKWTVTVKYVRLESSQNQDPTENPFESPLDREPETSVDTQTIMVAARGETDSGGNLIKAIATSAGEPYDPPPEEELEIQLIFITRWELPSFSMTTYYQYQNAVNLTSFTFGDLTINEGYAKIRIRIGKKEYWVSPDDGTTIPYRQYDYILAVSPLSWDIELLDWGSYYINGSGQIVRFLDDSDGAREFGLLDGSGGKLALGDPGVYNKWKNKVRVEFSTLSLPTGP